jgi:hypothetical protein
MSDWKAVHKAAKAFAAAVPSRAPKGVDSGANGDFLIPSELYSNTRDNIEKICRQINSAYVYDISDGAAVLIRKVVEILLILSFKHFGIEQLIKDQYNNYQELSSIVKEACQNSLLDLSRNAKEYLEIFREKGNLSAHNPFHISTKKDLETLQPKIRHLFQELLYKSGIRT